MSKADSILFQREVNVFSDKRHIFVVGMTGSGKTAMVETLATSLWKREKVKVIGFTLKSEMCMLGFPETDKKLISIMKRDFGKMPRPYPCEVYVPFVKDIFNKSKGKMKVNLPKHTDEYIEFQKKMKAQGRDYGWTTFKPFKISIEQLGASDWVALLKNVTTAGQTILNLVFEAAKFENIEELVKQMVKLAAKKNSRGADLVIGTEGDNFETVVGKSETYVSLVGLLSKLQKTGVIVPRSNPYVLNLDEMMKDRETITMFDLSGISRPIAHMIFSAIMTKVIQLRNVKHYPRALFVIPEVHNFAPAKASISPYAVSEYSSLGIMQHMSKEIRLTGSTLLVDSQRPNDVDKTFTSNFGWWAIGYSHKDMVTKINQDVVSIPTPALYHISELGVGQFCIIPIGFSEYQYPTIFCPSLGYHRKSGEATLDWIMEQRNVELVTYEDILNKALYSKIGEREIVDKVKIAEEKKDGVSLLLAARKLSSEGKSIREVAKFLGTTYYKTRKLVSIG